MSKKSDTMYNSKLQKSAFKGSAPQALCPAPSARSDVNDSQSFSFRTRDSTTGGKLPVHGPRRVAKPGPLFKGGCVTGSNSNKFHVSKSEIDNYNSIVKLALSEFQGLVLFSSLLYPVLSCSVFFAFHSTVLFISFILFFMQRGCSQSFRSPLHLLGIRRLS